MSKTNGRANTEKLFITILIPTVYKQDVSDLRRALLSLSASAPSTIKLRYVVFVDRAAVDFNVALYRSLLNVPFPVLYLWSHTPVGFTGAVNQALQIAQQKYAQDWFLVFNDDAVAKPSFWQQISVLKKQKNGVVSSAIESTQHNIDSNGLAESRWGVTLPIHERVHCKPSLFVGTSFFVHQTTVQQSFSTYGFFFFPLFFAYAEDFEFSVRLHRMRAPITIDQKLRVIHAGSKTAGRGSFFQLFHGLRNDLWVHILHQQVSLAMLWYILRYALYVVALSGYKGYWVLPLKIMGSTLKNFNTLRHWRTVYDQSLANHYSF